MQKSIHKCRRPITAIVLVLLLLHLPVPLASTAVYEKVYDLYDPYDTNYDTSCPEAYHSEYESENDMPQESSLSPQTDTFFHDVPEHAWYHPYITALVQLNIMDGSEGQTFSPHAPLTRAMFVTMLHRMYMQSDHYFGDQITAIHFYDVADDADYYDAVIWASTHGIVTGFSDHSFRPQQTINREQLIVMLHRYHTASGQPVSMTISPNIHYFRDYADISSWAKDATSWGVYRWILRGNHTFRVLPNNTTTRAQSAAIVYRFINPDSLPNTPQVLSCPGPEYIPAPPTPPAPPHPTRPFDTNRQRIGGRTWAPSDVDLLARCILAEARGRPGFYELVMVGRTVTNRVDANRNSGGGAYRATISGVIQQPRQFVWIHSGAVPQRYTDAAIYSLYRWAYGYDAPVNRFVRSGSDHRYLYFVGHGHTVGNFFRNGRFSDFVF